METSVRPFAQLDELIAKSARSAVSLEELQELAE
jgi:hypothetical protein